jgi:transcriptional regulator with XRE-family HTH domain
MIEAGEVLSAVIAVYPGDENGEGADHHPAQESGDGDYRNGECHGASRPFSELESSLSELISAHYVRYGSGVLSRVLCRFGADLRGGGLISAVEAERGGTRVSEGVPEDWAAVARAISQRIRELGWRQRELAERSHVSVAVVREIQRHTVERRRSPRTLESLSVALGWGPGRLDAVLKGRAEPTPAANRGPADGAALLSRLDAHEGRLDEIVKLLAGLKADLATVIEHVRHER